MFNSGQSKIATKAKCDRKVVVSIFGPLLSTEDIALGCTQPHQIGRANRDLKRNVDIRPVFHRREDRVRAIENDIGAT